MQLGKRRNLPCDSGIKDVGYDIAQKSHAMAVLWQTCVLNIRIPLFKTRTARAYRQRRQKSTIKIGIRLEGATPANREPYKRNLKSI